MSNNKFIDKVIDDIITEASKQYVDEMFDEIENTVKNENIVFSKEHQKNVDYILKGKYKKDDIKIKRPLKFNKKMFFVAVIVMIFTAGSVLSVSGVKVKLLNFMLDIKNQYTEFKYTETEPNGIENKYKAVLHYIPNGYVIDDVSYTNNNYDITYKNADKYFSVSKGTIAEIEQIDTEKAITQYTDINENRAFVSKKANITIISWINGEIEYSVDGNINYDELINIAKNIN
ncbi:MAG: DUF4367 domain-containing protein [Lachnospirales bacterium]